MSSNPYCGICGNYHYNIVEYYDREKSAVLFFCSANHRDEHIKKKNNPGYKTSYDIKSEKVVQEQKERLESDRERRRQTLDDIDDYYKKNPNGDYKAYEKSKKNKNRFFSFEEEEDTEEDLRRIKEVEEEDAKLYAWMKKYWYISISIALLVCALFYFIFIKDSSPNESNFDLKEQEPLLEEQIKPENQVIEEPSNKDNSLSETDQNSEEHSNENEPDNEQVDKHPSENEE